MKLSVAELKCLQAIDDGEAKMCLKNYRFKSADVLARHDLIRGNPDVPYWMWSLSIYGTEVLRLWKKGFLNV